MMIAIMAYTVAVAAALTGVGLCLEHSAGLLGLPRRKVWMATMLLSIVFPIAAMLGTDEPAIPDGSSAGPTFASDAPTLLRGTGQQLPTMTTHPKPIWQLAAPSDRQLMTMWVVGSSLFGVYLCGANLLLRRRAVNWQRTRVRGQEVLVSEVTGPALLGLLLPQIVVPRWLLRQSATVQDLILEHERQHIRTRDPILAVAGLLVIAAVPWNLLLWWQWRRMRQAMEIDCDARVLRTGVEAQTYAEVLLAVTKRAIRMPPGTLAMSEPVASLERRIDCLVPSMARHAVLQTMAALGLAAASAGAALALDAPALTFLMPRAEAVVKAPVMHSAAALPTTAPKTDASEPGSALPQVPTASNRQSTKTANMERSMDKTRRISVTVAAVTAAAVGAATAVQVQGAEQLASQPAEVNARTKAELSMSANDLNKDGIVTREEAAKVNGNLYLMWTVVYDMDHDGKVDVAELERANREVALGTALQNITGDAGGHLHKPKPELVIGSNDQNGDGTVTKEEAAQAGKALIRMWDSYDLNKDGKVDVAEVSKAEIF
jgi:beta-lactamase regulating signal transducer with metallopeptidase domain